MLCEARSITSERGSVFRRHTPVRHELNNPREEDQRRGRHRGPATQPGGDPSLVDEGGGCSCCVSAVGERRLLLSSMLLQTARGQHHDDFDLAGIDVADTEEEGSKTHVARGYPVEMPSLMVLRVQLWCCLRLERLITTSCT